MNISEKRIEEFRRLYQQNFNEQLDDNEAKQFAEKLVSLVKLIYRPIQKN